MKKVFLILSVLCAVFMAAGCKMHVNDDPSKKQQDSENNNPQNPEDPNNNETPTPPHENTRAENLDFIFNINSLGTTTITMKRSEWETLCNDYRYFYKNENCVHAQSYKYEKDGQSWELKNVGFRLRGNTSRVVPQGYDNGRLQGQMNKDWAADYYNYAEQPNDDYRQSHFKVDFEEFLTDDEEQKMAGCLKSIALKRMDSSCTREIFCYNLFRQNGVWTAPRASHTRLKFIFIEDDDSETEIDYGVYEMFEEVNKQSLKARESGDNNSAENAWANNKGNLWKCQNDLTDASGNGMGVEDIRIVHEGEPTPTSSRYTTKTDDYNGNRVGYIWDSYSLDLKTNKTKLDSAKTEFMGFISELNALPNPADENDTTAINTIKTFYEKWFDMDFFLKTYAINIICGMDDDYWGNANNYYLYFDTGKGGSGKVYFIPFDYDNTLGSSIQGEGILDDPMRWGRGRNRPLIDKLLLVPEYKELFKSYILDCLNNEYWNYENCSKLFCDWGTMVEPYLDSPDLIFSYGGAQNLWYGAWKPDCSLVDRENNLYDITRLSFTRWLTGNHLAISAVPNYSKGIKLRISNIPENAEIRMIYINNECVSVMDRVWSGELNKHVTSENIFDTDWQYPYVEAGKKYEIFVSYLDGDWRTIENSERIEVTPQGGLGELSVNNFDYGIENNKLVFTPALVIKSNGTAINNGIFKIEIRKTDWDWINGFVVGATCESLDFNNPGNFPRNHGVTKDTQLMIRLYYDFTNPNNPGDVYRKELVSDDESREKNLKLDQDFSALITKVNDDYVGLHLQFSEDLPDDVLSYEVLLDDKKVSEMERKHTDHGDEPADHINDNDWYYPYVIADKEYKVEVVYRHNGWDEFRLGPERITATSGVGEISLKNPVTYSIENNHLKFSGPIVIKIGNTTIQNPNCYWNIDSHGETHDGWISGRGLEPSELADFDLDLNIVISDEYRPIKTEDTLSFELVYNNEDVVETKGYNYRYYFFSHDDTRNQNIHLTSALESRYTVDYGTNSKPGITITINAGVIPSNAYSKEIYLNGMNVSEMERQYTDEGEKPAIHIADRSWYYPYVEAGKDYSFDIIYRTKDWNEAARFGPIKVKATTGLGELYVANKEDIRYEIKKINDKDNHFVFTTGPVIKYGSSTIENPNFKFNIDNQNGPKPDDKWIAGPEHPGSNIDIYLPDHIGDDRKPVKIDDTLSFEMYYKEYHEDLGYFYRCQIFNHDDTKNPGLHLTSDIVVP